MSTPGYVYLLHFDRPLGHAQHYIGWARNVDQRLAMHRRGVGSKLMAAVVAAGIGWSVAQVWDGDRRFERQLHKRHGASKFCPVCRAQCRPAANPLDEEGM